MTDQLFIKSIVTDERVATNFSDKYLPRYARDGELYVVDGILYVYSDLDTTDHGRWYPLTDQKEIYSFDQETESVEWVVPAPYHTDNIQIIIYDESDKIFKGDYTTAIENAEVTITFEHPVKGKVFIFVNKAFDWVTDRFVVGTNKFKVTADTTDENIYYLEVDTEYFEMLQNGNATFRSDVTVEGALLVTGTFALDGDQTITGNLEVQQNTSLEGTLTVFNDLLAELNAHIKGDLQVDGNTTIEGNLTVKGATTTVQTEQMIVADNIITLNAGTVGIPLENAGLEVDRGDDGILQLIYWDESVDKAYIPNNSKVDGNFEVTGLTTISNGLTVSGDVSITGDNVNIIATTLNVKDNIVTLNSGFTGIPIDNVGLEIDRGDNGLLPLITFDETNDYVTIPVKQTDDSIAQEVVATKPYVLEQVDLEKVRAEAIESGLDTRLTNVEVLIDDNANDFQDQLDAEVLARTNGDNTLQNNLDTEVTRASNAENTLTTNLNVEISNRTDADTLLQTNIDNEVTRASNAESGLQNDINTEITRSSNAENTLQANIDAEELRARNVEGSLVNLTTTDKSSLVASINEEISRAKTAESVIASGLTSESDIRELADNTLRANIDVEELRATNAESTLQGNIDTEEASRINDDNTLQTNIDNEVTRATGVEGDLTLLDTLDKTDLVTSINEVHTDVDNEVARATGIEDSLDVRLTSLENATTDSATGLQANIDAEVTRATGVEGDLALLDTTDKTNLVSAINEVHTDVDNEVIRATNAETTLQTNIDNEGTRASGVEGDITSLATDTQNSLVDAINEVHTNVDGEVVRATGAETTLQNNINTEKTRINAILNASTADADSFSEIVTMINTIDASGDATFTTYATANDATIAAIVDGTTPVEKANILTTARTISLSGDVLGSVLFNGGTDISILAEVQDDSHNHIIDNVDGLQSALDGKQDIGIYNTVIGTSTNLSTANASVVSSIEVTDGVITTMSTRTMTLLQLGFTGDNDANNYVHPITSGNKHIPSGGTTDSILRWASDGTAQWGDDVNTWRPISDSISTVDSDTAASLTAVKDAYDVGNHNHPYAATNGSTLEDFSGKNMVATTSFKTPIIYDYSNNDFYIDLSNGSTSINCAGQIVSSGDVVAFSDRRLKDNIKPIDNAINKVIEINGVTFTRNDTDDKTTRHTGVIAQEVEAVLPEAVTTANNGMKAVSYGNMVGLLIEAMKEQQQQINELKEEIKSLKDN